MNSTLSSPPRPPQQAWLTTYYFTRAAFSFAWLLAAVKVAPHSWAAAILLMAYPAWDALANLVDGKRSGGFKANPSQALNGVVSLVVAAAVAFSLPNMHRVLAVFGVWAILSGILQLATGARRWKDHGAQWPMLLSGIQSALAGGFFVFQSSGAVEPSVAGIAGYAGFGAFYFLLSALTLLFKARRRARSA